MGNPSIKFSCFNVLLALIKEEQLKAYKAGRKGFTAAYIPFIAVFLIVIFLSNCNTTEPDNRLEISVEDVSCTEAWIKVTVETGNEITLNRDGKEVERLTLTSSPQTVYDDSLLPNKAYTYQVSSIQNQESPERTSSNQLQVTTLDTTNHNITWQTFTFGGDAGSCVLYDCAIISEDNIWCVGDIEIADNSENGQTSYGVTHWNGEQWELRKIYYTDQDYQGNDFTSVLWNAKGIITFSSTDIWLAAGSVFHWDGKDTVAEFSFDILTQSGLLPPIIKLWGNSSSNLFGIGNSGSIIHYQNGIWQKIESGTDVNINDVWGVVDEYSNHEKVFCAVTNVLELSDHKILTIDGGNNVDSLHWDQDRRINSVWSNNGWIVYTSGGGVFNNKSGKWKEETSLPLYYTNRIRGNGLNDIFVAGDFGFLAHFNGAHWKIYDEFLFSASSLSVTVKGDMVIAIGRMGEQALIIMGKRN